MEKHDVRDGSGRLIRTVEGAERDAQAAMLHAKRHTYRQIAEIMGWDNPGSAHRAVQRALAAAGRDTVLEARQILLDELDLQAQAAWRVLESEHIVVNAGKVVRLNKKPIKDDGPVLEALDRLLKVAQERAKILGVYPAKRIEVFTHDSVDAAIALLEKELAGNDPAPADPGPGVTGQAALSAGVADSEE